MQRSTTRHRSARALVLLFALSLASAGCFANIQRIEVTETPQDPRLEDKIIDNVVGVAEERTGPGVDVQLIAPSCRKNEITPFTITTTPYQDWNYANNWMTGILGLAGMGGGGTMIGFGLQDGPAATPLLASGAVLAGLGTISALMAVILPDHSYPLSGTPTETHRQEEVLIGDAYPCQTDRIVGQEATLTFDNGEVVKAKTNAEGLVEIRPAMETVLDNASSSHAALAVVTHRAQIPMESMLAHAKRLKEEELARLRALASAKAKREARLAAERAARLRAEEAAKREAARLAAEKALREARARAEASVQWTGIFRGDVGGSFAAPVTQCTKTGVDACMDAVDNDCDGHYDQKCGYSPGVLQWTLSWTGGADLDLVVIGPGGVAVSSRRPMDETTGMIVDNSGKTIVDVLPDGTRQNVRNIYIPLDKVPSKGTYRMKASVVGLDSESDPTPISFTVGGRVGSRTWHSPTSIPRTVGATYHLAFANGPDKDRDGVVDADDACPDAEGRWSDEVKYRGCPDGDLDGVPDRYDTCAEEEGLADRGGCPLKFKHAWVTARGVKILANIEFDSGSARILKRSHPILDDVIAAIRAAPTKITKLAVEGHTDSYGAEDMNFTLSENRASSVVEYLNKHGDGLPGLELVPRGFGEYRPIADNKTKTGRQNNRRVEFVIVAPQPTMPRRW